MEGDDEDGWDDALGYLDACGPGVQHQIARTTSMEQNLAGDSSVASNASEMSQLLVDESQKEKVPSPPFWRDVAAVKMQQTRRGTLEGWGSPGSKAQVLASRFNSCTKTSRGGQRNNEIKDSTAQQCSRQSAVSSVALPA